MLNILVHNLNLAVHIGVPCYRQLNFYSQNSTEFLPERGYELGSSVGHDGIGHPEMAYPLSDEYGSHALSGNGLMARYRQRLLRQSIHDYKGEIVAVFV